MVDPLPVRVATESDAEALLGIYRPYVEETAVSFEMECPTAEDFAGRIRKSLSKWQWLVAEREGQCVGYAYGTSHREREAYQWSVEVSAYVDRSHQRQGIARALYQQLFVDLAKLGFCHAFAGVTLPNEASIALHRSFGFEPIGIFRSVGRKFDQWHDVAWFQKPLLSGEQ